MPLKFDIRGFPFLALRMRVVLCSSRMFSLCHTIDADFGL